MVALQLGVSRRRSDPERFPAGGTTLGRESGAFSRDSYICAGEEGRFNIETPGQLARSTIRPIIFFHSYFRTLLFLCCVPNFASFHSPLFNLVTAHGTFLAPPPPPPSQTTSELASNATRGFMTAPALPVSIYLIGPESTGKTRVFEALKAHLGLDDKSSIPEGKHRRFPDAAFEGPLLTLPHHSGATCLR